MTMPKMPTPKRPPIVTPLGAAKLKPIFIDRCGDEYCVRTLKPNEVTPEIARWLTDPAVMEGLNAPQMAMGIDAFRAYVASFDNLRRSLVAIRRRTDDGPLGLMMLEVDLRHKIGSLHIIIGDARDRRLTVALDAATIMVRHFFTERKMEKLTFQPLARNAAAVAVCKASRLHLEGTLRSHRIDGRTGERQDQMVFGLTLDEFNERERVMTEAGRRLPTYEGPGLPAKRSA